MYQALLVIFLLIAISLVLLIILQQNQSSNIGTSLGSSASGTFFRSSSLNHLMTRMIAILAKIFFIINLILCNFNSHLKQKQSQWNTLFQEQKNHNSLSITPIKTGKNIKTE